MSIFDKKKTNNKDHEYSELYDPNKIYLVTTEIISDCDDGSGLGPRCVTQKYLATKNDGKFYEIFSKVEIKYEDNSIPGFSFGEFNIPIIKEVEQLKYHVKNPNVWLTQKQLFYFITKENTDMRILENV